MSKIAARRWLTQWLTSPRLRVWRRRRAEWSRRLRGAPHRLHYFHRVDDPYCDLMLQVLPGFVRRFGVDLVPHVVANLDAATVPRPAELAVYARLDAARLAAHYDLQMPAAPPQDIATQALVLAEAASLGAEAFFSAAAGVAHGAAAAPKDTGRARRSLAADEALLRRRGHYLSATLWYGGEWYWGLDRLWHLELRFADLGLGAGTTIQFDRATCDVFEPLLPQPLISGPLEIYLSSRSPYSYIALCLARRFARVHGLELVVKPVLPMVMRGLPVPRIKLLYIVRDAKREAERAGLPFGRIADPLGTAVERIYAIGFACGSQDQRQRWFEEAYGAVFAAGEDMARHAVLVAVAARAGLSGEAVNEALHNDDWRTWVAGHREEMERAGLWGVPCLRYGNTWTWGQDRFWVIREALKNNAPT